MPYLIDAVYIVLLLAASPFLIVRSWATGKYRDGWGEKLLGRAPRRISDRPCIWFHAVSVGEVQLLRSLVAEISKRRPDWDVVISTTTPAGLEVARLCYPDVVTFYAPLDFSWAVRRALARVRPTVLALVELEVWPNLIREARGSGARVVLINGRLGSRSHRGYRRIKALLAPTFRRLDAVVAQSRDYAERFVDLGVPRERVRVAGSIKYDNLDSNRDNPRTLRLRGELGLRSTDLVFVAGSTMEGEEDAALAAYEAARVEHPRLRLILVPRHPERFDRVASDLEARGVRVERRSRMTVGPSGSTSHASSPGEPSVLLVDTMGELGAVWGLADVAFVGGSLFPGRGGQNMMEPAAYGASVLFGPYTSNFRDATEGLLACGGARRAADVAELVRALHEDLDDPERAAVRGEAGRAFVLAQHGATERTFQVLGPLIDPRVGSRYRTPAATARS